MKTEDLMIGDWYYWEAEGKMYPYQITAEDFVKGEIPNFQPIPLTPEILEKNGFRFSRFHGWQIKEPELTIDFVGDTPHFLLDEIFLCDCPYVHTLQHALKLCGIETNIIV